MRESKTIVVPPYIPAEEMLFLSVEEERKIRERCGFDADYPVSISYECDWSDFPAFKP